MKPLSIRAYAWALTHAGLVVAALTGAYATFRLVPVIREVRAATAPLPLLAGQVVAYDRWVVRATMLAQRALVQGSAHSLDSLRQWMGRYDRLAGGLRLADLPDSVRILLAAADENASRFAVNLEEFIALAELGRRDDAARRLDEAKRLEQALHEVASEAQALGIRRVMRARQAVENLSVGLLAAFGVWVLGTAVVLGVALRFVRRRVAGPLWEFQAALGRMAEGDLGVQLTTHADDEIGGLTRQFNQMTAVLRSRAEAQGQMAAASVLLANAAHEVNNPLMSIGAMAESRLSDSGVPAPIRRDLEEILQQVRRASRLVRGIVRFVRPAPAGEPRADVNEVAREALELLAFQFAADGVVCTPDLTPDLPRAQVDTQALEHILVALLANAHEALARAGTADRRVTVRTSAQDGQVCLEVRDTGPGVAPEMRGRLFVPFAMSRVGGHVGLGLYTARRIAREAGGDLTYEQPAAGPGAVFLVTLSEAPAAPAVAAAQDVAPAESRAPAVPPARTASIAGLRILLVEDEPAVRAPLARFLTRRGATVREAGDGEEALAALASEPADVVIADLRMPVMDGIGLYRALQTTDSSLAARMLFLSGDVAQLGATGDEIAADRVLPKPVELNELESFILSHQ